MRNIIGFFSIMFCLTCVFSACEMKKELKGDDDSNELKGILDLSLAFVPETKSSVNPEVEDFNVTIYDEEGDIAVYYDSYAAFKAAEQVLLPIGSYNVVCAWGDNKEAAFDSPYFKGIKKCEIKDQEVTKVDVSAEIQNVRVDLALSSEFLKNYKDNYTVTLTNGKGVLILNKDEKRSAYFMPGSILKYTIKATTLDGKEAMLSGLLQNESGSIVSGDQFKIEITVVPVIPDGPVDPDDPVDPNDPNQVAVSIQVKVTLVTREIEIVVPTIPADPVDPDDTTSDIEISGSGFDIDKTQEFTVESAKNAVVNVNLSAPDGMMKVEVKIISPALEAILGNENPFDLISPSSTMQAILDGIKLKRPSSGDTSFMFEIGPFMQLLGEGEHKFQVTLTDAKGKSLMKTLSVKIMA